MPEFHPDAELAPRDVVSRAVFSVMVSTGDTNVYLDLSDVDGDPHVLFPGISRICRFFGIDIAKDPVPVRPGAHYQVGGLLVDSEGRTSVPGLWAVGECASSGLHGANRMGSNSLLEGAVLGAACGHAAAAERTHPEAPSWTARKQRVLPKPPVGVRVNIEDMIYSLKSLMWRQMGVERTRAGIEDALAKITDHAPDVIFCDIMMPRLDGYQTCALIKKNARYNKTPVIMLSSKDGLFDRARGRMVGSDEYLTKPFTKDSLLRTVGVHAAART